MKLEIDLPDRVGVMTLPEVAFFPKVMMPLFIFEPRYRSMLKTSLEGNRMFVVAGINDSDIGSATTKEPAHEIATIGFIRGCRTNGDGTSQLILQGLSRIHLDKIYEDKSFREAAITPLKSTREVDRLDLMELQDELFVLVKKLAETDSNTPGDLLKFLEDMEEAEDFVDLVAYTFVEDVALKQKVLETLRIEKRFELLIEAMS